MRLIILLLLFTVPSILFAQQAESDSISLRFNQNSNVQLASDLSEDISVETVEDKSNICAIAGPGAASSYAPLLLFIPALILTRRLLRKQNSNSEA